MVGPFGEVLLLGVDGGGTHTRALVADGSGRVLGRGVAGPSNAGTAGGELAGAGLARAVGAALEAAGVAARDIAGACFGLAGLDRPQDEREFRALVSPLGLSQPAVLVNDAVIAWAGATGGRPGIIVSAGTGSVAYGRGADGREARAGGWGSPFGDEGSAYWIACEALRAVLRGVDGRDPPSSLAEPLARVAGFSEPADLCLLARVDRAAAIPLEAQIASLAPAVAEAAAAGEATAARILDRAAQELLELALAVRRALGDGEGGLPVFGLGSVLWAANPTGRVSPVATRLDALLRAAGGSGLCAPRYSALVGAVILAWEQARPHTPLPPEPPDQWQARV
jgi:N-acetylglucosamine kinase-like BadF-type ATPase